MMVQEDPIEMEKKEDFKKKQIQKKKCDSQLSCRPHTEGCRQALSIVSNRK